MTGRCGVVVAHGQLGEGFLSALERVAGQQNNLWPVSNEGLDGAALVEAIESLLADRGAGREAFLFTDLDGGSCGQACRRLLTAGRVKAVFYGISLPLLIEFVFLQDQPLQTMVTAIVAKSRGGLGAHL